jgi:hypothetical protein
MKSKVNNESRIIRGEFKTVEKRKEVFISETLADNDDNETICSNGNVINELTKMNDTDDMLVFLVPFAVYSTDNVTDFETFMFCNVCSPSIITPTENQVKPNTPNKNKNKKNKNRINENKTNKNKINENKINKNKKNKKQNK